MCSVIVVGDDGNEFPLPLIQSVEQSLR